MADDVLTQAELDMLFRAWQPEPRANGALEVARVDASHSDSLEPPREKIVPYDFRHPQPVPQDQLRTLGIAHERFAHQFAAAITTMLRGAVEVKLTAVEQVNYGQFIGGLENPTCLQLLRASPPGVPAFLDINPAALFPMIDRMLGGGHGPTVIARRPLTAIETRLASRVTSLVLQELRAAWQQAPPVELSVERVECNPQAINALPPGDAVVLISFEIAIRESRGAMKLCLTHDLAARIASHLATDWTALRPPSGETMAQASESLRQAPIELVARLAETKITSGDLYNLRVGDIIATEKGVESPIAVCLEGITKFRAHPGAFQGHKAIRIEEAVHPSPVNTARQ